MAPSRASLHSWQYLRLMWHDQGSCSPHPKHDRPCLRRSRRTRSSNDQLCRPLTALGTRPWSAAYKRFGNFISRIPAATFAVQRPVIDAKVQYVRIFLLLGRARAQPQDLDSPWRNDLPQTSKTWPQSHLHCQYAKLVVLGLTPLLKTVHLPNRLPVRSIAPAITLPPVRATLRR